MTQAELFDIGLYSICDAVHGTITGSGDPLRDTDMDEMIAYLRSRLDRWKPSIISRFGAYDSAMYALCLATITEYEATR